MNIAIFKLINQDMQYIKKHYNSVLHHNSYIKYKQIIIFVWINNPC